eukprot:snap_masked-scaffold_4-processed-gene-19.45-mRNA-1 protein AED:1.00 eAED:1.00 QI:0/-1/0/0/-1/1/1/0/211
MKKKQLKKIARQLELEKERKKNLIVRNFLQEPDVLRSVESFRVFNSFEVLFFQTDQLENNGELKEQMFQMTKTNVKDAYIKNGWKWNDTAKKRELFSSSMSFLIVVDSSGKLKGFAALEALIEFNTPTLYIYEIHVETSCRRSGIGNHLLTLSALLANKFKFSCLRSTVFKDNIPSLNLFKKAKYVLDTGSPLDETYSILIKPTKYISAYD